MKTLAIGIDIGGTRTKVGLVDLRAGQVLDTRIYPTETQNATRFEQTLSDAIHTMRQSLKLPQAELKGVGIGVSSFVFADGTVDSTYGFLAFMEDYPLARIIEKNHTLPCRLDNDARLVALGETLYGSGRGFDRVLVLTLGTGLGLGFVVNQRLEGKLPFGHMGGHMTVTQNNQRCYCGKMGCLESLVSATGMMKSAERLYSQEARSTMPETVEAIFEGAQGGNGIAKQLVEEYLAHLRTGLGNYINIFAPDRIVLGGGVAKGLGPYLSELLPSGQLGPYKNYQTTVVQSALEEQSGILGSAAIFL